MHPFQTPVLAEQHRTRLEAHAASHRLLTAEPTPVPAAARTHVAAPLRKVWTALAAARG